MPFQKLIDLFKRKLVQGDDPRLRTGTVLDTDGRLHAQPFYVVFGFAPRAYGLATLGRASQAQVVHVAQRGGMRVLVLGHPPGRIVPAGPPTHLGLPAGKRILLQGAAQ